MERKEIVTELLKNGAKSITNLKIKNVTIDDKETYVRLGITLDKPVRGMVTKDNGVTYEEGEVNIIFTSTYAIASLLKDDDDAAFAANHLADNPTSLSVILSRATIDIVQENVVSGQEYKNPFSNSDNKTVFTHDTIITHITSLKLTDKAIAKLDKLADKMLGI